MNKFSSNSLTPNSNLYQCVSCTVVAAEYFRVVANFLYPCGSVAERSSLLEAEARALSSEEALLHYHIFHMHLEAMFTEPYRHTSSPSTAVKLTLTTNCTHRLTDAAPNQIHTDTFTRYILFSFRLFSIFVSILYGSWTNGRTDSRPR